MRRDGSSRFGANNRWATFPAGGIGWVISKEPFFNIDAVTNLKIHASYGITGNQSGIGSYESLGLWSGEGYGQSAGIVGEQLANPNLKWETTRQFDIGLNMGFLNGRVTLTYDYYSKQTNNLLLAAPIPFTTGFTSVVRNFGKLSNKGMELSITGTPIQKESLSWDIRFNIAGNRNLVEKLEAPFTVTRRNLIKYKEGYPMYSYFLYKELGVNPKNGKIIYKDVNGDGHFSAAGDRTILGSALPKFYGGLTNTISYKNISLSFSFQYNYGNQLLYMNRYFLEHGGTRTIGYLDSQLKRWTHPGQHTMVPKMVSSNYKGGIFPSRLLSSGSYLKLRKLKITYNLPSNFINNLGIRGANIYFSGQNLFIITNYIGLAPGLTFNTGNSLVRGIEFSTIPHATKFLFGLNIHI